MVAVIEKLSPRARFWLALAAIALVGFGLRATVIFTLRAECPPGASPYSIECYYFGGDPSYVQTQGIWLAAGEGFVDGGKAQFLGVAAPGAAHPPLPSVLAAAIDLSGTHDVAGVRLVYALIGSLGLLAVGAAARAADPQGRVGPALIASSIAAVYPILWMRDVQLAAEAVFMPLAALVILAAYRYRSSPSLARATWLGVAIGACWLTRGEAVLLLGTIALPVVLRCGQSPWRTRAAHIAVAAAATAMLMAPWTVYNLTRFHRPVFVTTSSGVTLLLSSCDEAFSGPHIGYFIGSCSEGAVSTGSFSDESDLDAAYRAKAMEYLSDHLGQLPIVAVHRVGRIWYLYPPAESRDKLAVTDIHGFAIADVELATYYLVLAAAVGGAVTLRRNGVTLWPFAGWVIEVTITAAAFAAVSRYRAGADIGLVVLAGFGVDAARRRFLPGPDRTAPTPDTERGDPVQVV